MTIFTAGKSVAINSPRHLTLRHARRRAALSRGIIRDDDSDALDPGEEELNSFWKPSLTAGPQYHISVSQNIQSSSDGPILYLKGEQDFIVDAPQFSLPDGSVYSFYPPAGYPDDCRILPHVVLTDPHLPWERDGSSDDDDDRNRVPWLALFTFAEDELRLSKEALDGDSSIFKNTSDQLPKPVKQTANLAVNMTVADVWETTDVVTPVSESLGPETIKTSRGNFIFVKSDLFTSLFSPFDDNNNRITVSSPDTSQYKYLSHVRKINSTGMAIAGVEDVGIFSVVMSNRCGPINNNAPVSVSTHLVSIEGVDVMDFPIEKDYVALCSLHSWSYTVTPQGMLDVPDAFESIGNSLDFLSPPAATIQPLISGEGVSARVGRRLKDGYSLIKYRTQTGEQTVALLRGPLTPSIVLPLSGVQGCSNCGQDLQIMDGEVGIMDLSYSSAWQLGRTMALGDQAFTAALFRLRAAIYTSSMKESKIEVIRTLGTPASFRTRTDLLGDLRTMAQNLSRVQIVPPHLRFGHDEAFKRGGSLKRWHQHHLSKREFPSLGFSAPEIEEKYHVEAAKAARALAKATDGFAYNETNAPVSTDWMIVLAWVMDRMFLSGVPAHYLITDPSHLEPESLRFFHIDPNWVDAMIDGALSLANHTGTDKDRVAIKKAINDYIQGDPDDPSPPPQIPIFGFYLRSDLVTRFPDLKVTICSDQTKGTTPDRAPLLRHEIVADGVMMCLLDRRPGSPDFTSLVFTQPPHQQRFAVGSSLDSESLHIDIRRQYTVDEKIREQDPDLLEVLKKIDKGPSDTDNWFVWGTTSGSTDLRILRLPYYATQQRQILSDDMGTYTDASGTHPYFNDDTATSALLALQLNDPIYSLTIQFNSGTSSTSASLQTLRDRFGLADEPRMLRRMEPSQVRRFSFPEHTREDEAPHSSRGDENDALVEMTTFTRHESYKPAPHVLLRNLGPHTRTVPSAGSDSKWTRTAGLATYPDGSDPASGPEYTCSIYTPNFDTVQTGDSLPQDLIFSVLVSNNENSDYKLVEFDICIPLGTVDSEKPKLMENYNGPGPSMLSNLRFNVLVSYDDDGQLCLRLIPRSSSGSIPAKAVDEMGFLLCLADVNEFGVKQTQVTVSTITYYENLDPIDGDFTVNIINSSVSS